MPVGSFLWALVAAEAVAAACALGATAPMPGTCSSHKHQPGIKNVTIMVQGLPRIFQLYTPYVAFNYTHLAPPTSPAPLHISWHGCTRHPSALDYYTDITRVIDTARDHGSRLQPWYVIVPLGTQITSQLWGWNSPDGNVCGGPAVDDVAFASAIIDFAARELCVNASRIYTSGHSNGGFLSASLACLMPGRLGGVAVSGATMGRGLLAKCERDSGAIPVLSFYSLADQWVPLNGSDRHASLSEVNSMWRRRNGCTGAEQEGPIASFTSATTSCQRWLCPNAPVESCLVGQSTSMPVDLDHCWVGGRSAGFPTCRPRPGDVDATAHMMQVWDALARQTLPAPLV